MVEDLDAFVVDGRVIGLNSFLIRGQAGAAERVVAEQLERFRPDGAADLARAVL